MADTILASLKEACDDSDASLDFLEGMEGSTFLEALIAAREEEEDDFDCLSLAVDDDQLFEPEDEERTNGEDDSNGSGHLQHLTVNVKCK